MIDLQEILLKKWGQDNMAHFYILQAPTHIQSAGNFLNTWINEFIYKVLMKEKNISKEESISLIKNGHADLLFIEKEDKQKNYSITDGDFLEFFKILSHKNYELKRRFIIVSDAHLINKTMANKLLKTLEEPPEGTTIFFLRPIQKALLSTINSRAICLTVSKSNTIESEPINYHNYQKTIDHLLQNHGRTSDEAQELSCLFKDFGTPPFLITPVIDALKNKKHWQSSLFHSLIELSIELPLKFESKQDFLNKIKWFEKSKTFNNSMNERMTNLVMSLHYATMSLDKSKQN
jgi:hypothetical protein